MGLQDAVAAHHTSETGLAFVDEDGHQYSDFPAGAEDPQGSENGEGAHGADSNPTAELEILRGHLARILYDHSAGCAEYRFGDHITALHDDGHGVDVDFAHSPSRLLVDAVLHQLATHAGGGADQSPCPVAEGAGAPRPRRGP